MRYAARWRARRFVGGGVTTPTPTPTPTPASPLAVTPLVIVAGDSWTMGNEAKISRNGSASPVEADRWDYQLSQAMGVANVTDPTVTGLSSGVVNAGYGGQNSATILTNVQNLITAEPAKAQATWTWWAGRNDVTSPGGETWPDVTLDKAGQFLAAIPHDRKVVFFPYGGIGVTGSETAIGNWVRAERLKWAYRRAHRRYVYDLFEAFAGLSPNGSDGTAANDALVAGGSVPQNMFASAATDQQHPNYLSSPLIAAALKPMADAMQNKAVHMALQTVPDVPCDMAAGAKIEVYARGYVTGASIAADDAFHPGLFTVAVKAGSTDTLELTRTAVSPGMIPAIIRLSITVTGKDVNGADVSHTGKVRIVPTTVGSAVTTPLGCRLIRDTHATTTSRRWPMMRTSVNPFPASQDAFTFVVGMKLVEDGFLYQMYNHGGSGNGILIQRTTANAMLVRIEDTAGAVCLNNAVSLNTVPMTAAGGDLWFAFSCRLSGTPTYSMWAWSTAVGIDTNVTPATAIVAGNGLVATEAKLPNILGLTNGQATFTGSLRRMWVDNRYIDFNDAANRRLFWNGDGTPALPIGGTVGGTKPQYDLFAGHPGDTLMGRNFGTAADVGFVDNWNRGFPEFQLSMPRDYGS